jgi:hypothetical protein
MRALLLRKAFLNDRLNRSIQTLLWMVEPEDMVLSKDDPRSGLQGDRALDLSTVDETDGSVLKDNKDILPI